MLEKAIELGIVVERTNLYDYFFIHKKECKAKVTAARLPYFDGDYWPGAAEDMISKFCLTEGDQNIKNKGKIKSTITKRDLKAAGVTDLNGSASKDAMLMQKVYFVFISSKYMHLLIPLNFISDVPYLNHHFVYVQLGELICPIKEDFIMVHLHYSCSHCCILMVSGRRWECSQCKSFYICDK
jgi:E1A/CREB-binding protein